LHDIHSHKILMKKFLLPLIIAFCTGTLRSQPDKSRLIRELLAVEELKGFSGSVLVAENGKILFENGVGFADREAKRRQTTETVFSIGSITKQFTAAAIMKLEAEGKLSVNDSLSKHFPNASMDKQNITLHQLLTHTSGFAEVLGDDYDTLDAKEFTALAMGSPLVHKPGEKYLYSNVGYSLLGIIVKTVSGKGYEEYLRDALFLPSGMLNTGYVIPGFTKGTLAVGYKDGKRWGTALDHPWKKGGPGWHLRANGGILSTVGDMHKWYLSLRNNTVLPKAQTEKMFTAHVAEGPQQLSHYGYGWVVQRLGEVKLIWHNGGNGVYNAYVGFDLANDIFIVVSSNANNTVSDRIAAELFNIVSDKAKLKIAEEEPGFGSHPATKKILEAINKYGAEYFSKNSTAVLKEAGFDFENDMILAAVGEQLEEAGKWDEGIALYKSYTELFPRIVVGWNRLGKCYMEKGEKQKAKESWEKSVSIRATNNRAVGWLEEIQ
jgi:CubicO group peptidase (beta-lactamase class C family)